MALLTLSPGTIPLRLNLARALHGQGDLSEAVAQYRDVLRVSPVSVEAHYNLALALRVLLPYANKHLLRSFWTIANNPPGLPKRGNLLATIEVIERWLPRHTDGS